MSPDYMLGHFLNDSENKNNLINNNMETTITMADLVARDINRTNGKFFTIVFTKKDGTIRKMTCRTGVSKGVTGKGLAFEPKEKGLKVVWSTDAEGYRMINLAQVTEITFNGTTTIYNNQ